MKILHVVPSYKPAYVYGGPIESIAKLCEGLADIGFVAEVYTTTANGTSELPVIPNESVVVEGVKVTYFSRITKDPTHASPALWKSLYKNCRDYDVIHIHSWWNVLVIVAAAICHWRKSKVVISPRGMLSNYIFTSTNNKIKQAIHFLGGKKALRQSFFHATSEAEYEECRKLVTGWRGFMLPNILTLPDIPVCKEKNEYFTLIFLSRIHPKKGIEILLEAMSKIDINIMLKIAGTGYSGYIDQLKGLIKSLGIEDKVTWLGWKERNEKFKEIMQADLFVLTSYNENFANVVIEALHAGTPVLLSGEVGLARFVKKEKMGWIVPLKSDDIARSIYDIVINRADQLQWIQQHSRSIIGKHFSEPELIRQYREMYTRVAAS